MTHAKRFGKHLRELRYHFGLTQEEVAKRTGLSRAFLFQLEIGKTTPSLDSIIAILDAYMIKFEEFRK